MIRRATLALSTVALVAAASASAEMYYLSQPGLCNVSDGELELSDAIILGDHSIGNHFFDCVFKTPIAARIKSEQWTKVKADCENGTKSWRAVFEFSVQDNGDINVFQNTGGLSPVRFYHCDE